MPWHSRYRIEPESTSYFQVGPLHLWVQSQAHQWRVCWEHEQNWLEGQVRSLENLKDEAPPDGIQDERFAYRSGDHELQFSAALCDRPVVARLEKTLSVLPGEDVTIYLSTPLWVRIEMTAPLRQLCEIPTFRLSDTWFGPVGARDGEISYASRTLAVLRLQDVPFRPHCAVTAVRLINRSEASLRLDRLNLPLPRLSLFLSEAGFFWTEMVTLERKDDSNLAGVKLERQPPQEAGATKFVSGPRIESGDASMVVRAFTSFFKDKSES